MGCLCGRPVLPWAPGRGFIVGPVYRGAGRGQNAAVLPAPPSNLAAVFAKHLPGGVDATGLDGAALEARLQARVSQAAAAWPELEVPVEGFVAFLAERLLPGTPVEQGLEALHAGDLLLAFACSRNEPLALRHFDEKILSQAVRAAERMDTSPAFLEDLTQQLRQKLFVGDRPRRRLAQGRRSSCRRPRWPPRTRPWLAYQSSHPHYGQPLSVPREKLATVLGTPPGPGRDALIQSLGLGPVANRLVADTYDMATLTAAVEAVHAAIDANRSPGAGHNLLPLRCLGRMHAHACPAREHPRGGNPEEVPERLAHVRRVDEPRLMRRQREALPCGEPPTDLAQALPRPQLTGRDAELGAKQVLQT